MGLSRKEIVCKKCRKSDINQNLSKHWDSRQGMWVENETVIYDCADCGECDVETVDVPLPLLKTDIFEESMDGNAWAILSAFSRQAEKEGWTGYEISIVRDIAKDGDYDHLVQTIMGQIDTGEADES